jgi:small subunit ribosomal protein S24e
MIKVITQKEIPLLNRKIMNLDFSFTGSTPKKEIIKKEVAGFLKTKEDLIVVKKVSSRFGEESINVLAHVYDKVEDLKKIEEIKKKPKNKENKEAKPETQKPEKKEEAKPDEKVEEKPKEEESGKEESKEQKTK